MHPLVAAHLPPARAPVRRGLGVLAVAGLLVAANRLPAAAVVGDVATTVVSVGVASAVTLEGLTPSIVLPRLPGATETGSKTVAYRVLTNDPAGYTVSVQADAPTFTADDPSADVVPIGDLEVAAGGSGAYVPVSHESSVTLHSAGSRTDEAGDDYVDDYQLHPSVPEGCACTATLSYVVTPG